jgi:hypothetical protein
VSARPKGVPVTGSPLNQKSATLSMKGLPSRPWRCGGYHRHGCGSRAHLILPSRCQVGAHQYADSQGPTNIGGPVYGDELSTNDSDI